MSETEKKDEKAVVVGDVVRLKSGGPQMTVVRNDDGEGGRVGWFVCVRFNRNDRAREYVFPFEALEVIPEDERRPLRPFINFLKDRIQRAKAESVVAPSPPAVDKTADPS